MRAFLLLTRVQVLGLVNSLAPVRSGLSRSQRRGRIALIACGFALLAIIMMGYLAIMAFGLAVLGLARVLPALAVALGSLAGVVFTFLKANGTLFGFKDYDLVMSLPVSRRALVASRMAALMGSSITLAFCAMLPLYAVYFISVPPRALSVFAAVASMVLAPLAPTALATLAAYAVTWVAARFRHANLAFVALGFIALLAFFGGSASFSASVNSQNSAEVLQGLGQMGTMLEGTVCALYPPAAWAGSAITEGSLAGLIEFTAFSLGVAGTCLEVMQQRYLALNASLAARKLKTRSGRTATGEQAPMGGAARTRTPFWTIVHKELRTLIGIPTYAFNCLFGYVFTIGIAVFLGVTGLQDFVASGSINGIEVNAEQAAEMIGNIRLILPWAFLFCGIMCTSSVVSISIEGRAAWLMATAPVSTRTMLGAKLASSAIPFGASLAVAVAILFASGEATPLMALECLLVGLGAFALWVCLGMSVDVRRPNLSWMNPQDVVKRGAPMNTCILGGLVYTFLAGALVFAASLSLGLVIGHVANVALGIASLCLGALIFHHTVTSTPALRA